MLRWFEPQHSHGSLPLRLTFASQRSPTTPTFAAFLARCVAVRPQVVKHTPSRAAFRTLRGRSCPARALYAAAPLLPDATRLTCPATPYGVAFFCAVAAPCGCLACLALLVAIVTIRCRYPRLPLPLQVDFTLLVGRCGYLTPFPALPHRTLLYAPRWWDALPDAAACGSAPVRWCRFTGRLCRCPCCALPPPRRLPRPLPPCLTAPSTPDGRDACRTLPRFLFAADYSQRVRATRQPHRLRLLPVTPLPCLPRPLLHAPAPMPRPHLLPVPSIWFCYAAR